MKTAILGGTFNPPHLGHERMIETAEKAIKPDRFLLIPTYIPPHKAMSEGSPTPEQRLNMCRLAFGHFDFLTLCDMELERGGNSYTVDTLKILKEQNPDDDIYFIVGSDSLIHFTEWRDFEGILGLCTLFVLPRENDDYPLLCRIAEEYEKKFGGKIVVYDAEPVVISSTDVRTGRINKDTVCEDVLRYIDENHLYNR